MPETTNAHDEWGSLGRRARKANRIGLAFGANLRCRTRFLSCSDGCPLVTRCLMKANLLLTDSFNDAGCWTSFLWKKRAWMELHTDCLRFENLNKTFHALNFSSSTGQISSENIYIKGKLDKNSKKFES